MEMEIMFMNFLHKVLLNKPLHIYIASLNPAKIKATETAFARIFPKQECIINAHAVPSNVPDQPFNEETFVGAKNRLNNLLTHLTTSNTPYDFAVSLEGGIHKFNGDWFCYAASYVQNKTGLQGHGTSPMYPLPKKLVAEVQAGDELGHVLGRYLNDPEAKKKGGTIGLLTHNQILRDELLSQGVLMALVPFLHPDLWSE